MVDIAVLLNYREKKKKTSNKMTEVIDNIIKQLRKNEGSPSF